MLSFSCVLRNFLISFFVSNSDPLFVCFVLLFSSILFTLHQFCLFISFYLSCCVKAVLLGFRVFQIKLFYMLLFDKSVGGGELRRSAPISWGEFSSVAQSCLTLCNPMHCSTPGFPVHHQLPEPTKKLHWVFIVHWVSDAIQPSHALLSLSPPAFNLFQHQFFPVSQFFASARVLPMNIQDWFPLGLTGLISLQSKGLSRVFSSTTVQEHQFFSTQLSLWSNSHIHTGLLEKP